MGDDLQFEKTFLQGDKNFTLRMAEFESSQSGIIPRFSLVCAKKIETSDVSLHILFLSEDIGLYLPKHQQWLWLLKEKIP